MRELKKNEERKRNPLTIRWTDEEHALVTETAWKNRTNASALVRELVLENIGKEELMANTN